LSSFLPTRPEGKCLAAPLSRSSFAFPKFRVVWLSPFQKITDKIQYLIKVCLKRFMTAIDNVDLGSGQVPLITMRFVHVEKHIIFSPNDQCWRLVITKVLLKHWEHVDIVFEITIQLKLHIDIAGPFHTFPIEQP